MSENPYEAPAEKASPRPSARRSTALRIGCVLVWILYLIPVALFGAFLVLCATGPGAKARTLALPQVPVYVGAGLLLLAVTVGAAVAARRASK